MTIKNWELHVNNYIDKVLSYTNISIFEKTNIAIKYLISIKKDIKKHLTFFKKETDLYSKYIRMALNYQLKFINFKIISLKMYYFEETKEIWIKVVNK